MQETDGVAGQIAAQLGETAFAPKRQIQRIVAVLGVAQAQGLLAEALDIEARGGLRLPDGSRRRTPGGVFFQLVKARVSARQRWLLFRRPPPRRTRSLPSGSTEAPLTWATRLPVARAAQQQQGVIDDVKIFLVGRPGVVVARPNCVITAMASTHGPSLPRGLPAIPETPTTYTVYIAHHHWNRVAEALANPDDALVVEGWAAFDPELEGIAVFATFVTTQLTRAQRKGK
jgi:hypothetical protein